MCISHQVLSENAIDQRLRSACTSKRKRRATGGLEASKLYEDQRDHLARLLIDAGFAKAQ